MLSMNWVDNNQSKIEAKVQMMMGKHWVKSLSPKSNQKTEAAKSQLNKKAKRIL